MQIITPEYYHHFRCVAAACPDSCCKEWEVDVDADAAARYRALPGALGDRLRQVLRDTEDGTVMTIENGRCPMWRQDGLCRIQAELGHETLCRVCREFPRLRHDYGDFVELGLELSCPEAARLILTTSGVLTTETVQGGEEPAYDQDAMGILRRSREEVLRFLADSPYTAAQTLAVLLLYGHAVQAELDGGEEAVLCPEQTLQEAEKFAKPGDMQAVFRFFKGLEILTPQWEARLNAGPVEAGWAGEMLALCRYFVGRYWLQAVSDYDLICRVKFAVIGCLLIHAMGGDAVETAQQFSKEIENDPDNAEAILDGAYTSPAFTDVALLGLLLLP